MWCLCWFHVSLASILAARLLLIRGVLCVFGSCPRSLFPASLFRFVVCYIWDRDSLLGLSPTSNTRTSVGHWRTSRSEVYCMWWIRLLILMLFNNREGSNRPNKRLNIGIESHSISSIQTHAYIVCCCELLERGSHSALLLWCWLLTHKPLYQSGIWCLVVLLKVKLKHVNGKEYNKQCLVTSLLIRVCTYLVNQNQRKQCIWSCS